jgi:hypothetical protein
MRKGAMRTDVLPARDVLAPHHNRRSVMKLMLVLALTACFPAAQRSRDVLGDALSQAEVRATPHEAGRAIVRLFATRGFSLVAQNPIQDGLVLRFRGHREVASYDGGQRAIQFGSTFFVAITTAPDGQTRVSIDGAPIVDEKFTCWPERSESCEATGIGFELSGHVNGRAEAEVVSGVFAELALEGLVIDWERRSREGVQARQQLDRERCTATRHRMLTAAYATDDKREQARLIAAAPSCR